MGIDDELKKKAKAKMTKEANEELDKITKYSLNRKKSNSLFNKKTSYPYSDERDIIDDYNFEKRAKSVVKGFEQFPDQCEKGEVITYLTPAGKCESCADAENKLGNAVVKGMYCPGKGLL